MKGKPYLDHAILLSTNEEITLAHYLDTQPRRLPPGVSQLVCPVCLDDVHLVRMHDRNRTPTFVHVEGDQANCPLVNVQFASPAFASAHAYDIGLEQERRDRFMDQWPLYLAGIRLHAPHYSIDRFTATLAHADVLHIWSSPTLTDADVLYVFLALSAFIAEIPGTHSTWLRFLFDASVSGVDDLHPARQPAPRLFRLRYRSPHHGMFPNANHLLDWREVPMNDQFLHYEDPYIPASEIRAFNGLMATRAGTPFDDEGPTIPLPGLKE